MFFSVLSLADIYAPYPESMYIYVNNNKKKYIFSGHEYFFGTRNEKYYSYSDLETDTSESQVNFTFLKSIDFILLKKNIPNGTYLINNLYDCAVDFSEVNFSSKEAEKISQTARDQCLSSIQFNKIGDTQFSYFYEKMKWIFLSKFY